MIQLFEVGPRDGLQNQPKALTVEQKVGYIRRLLSAGLPRIEVGAYVSPRWVPQMADTSQVVSSFKEESEACRKNLWALIPNAKGLNQAIQDGLQAYAFFTAASESFCTRNQNKSIRQTLDEIGALLKSLPKNAQTRAYISTVTHCPYEGPIKPHAVSQVLHTLSDFGINEISLGETLGKANPWDIRRLLDEICSRFPNIKFFCHFHDTYGMGLANMLIAYREYGVSGFDTSTGGLGGCPYAKGAAGNCATEDLVYAFPKDLHGLCLEKVLSVSRYVEDELGISLPSRVFRASTPKE